MLPRPFPHPGTPVPRSTPDGLRSNRPAPQAFLRSAMPALDRAFGLEPIGDCPDDIADLIERLHAGPLGHRAENPVTASERIAVPEAVS